MKWNRTESERSHIEILVDCWTVRLSFGASSSYAAGGQTELIVLTNQRREVDFLAHCTTYWFNLHILLPYKTKKETKQKQTHSSAFMMLTASPALISHSTCQYLPLALG